MADEIVLVEWVLGGAGTVGVLAAGYFMNAISKSTESANKTSEDLATHKTHVAETYLTKNEFSATALRLEGRIEAGNKANLESNEKIRTEMNANQGTLINLIANIKGGKA